MWKHREREEKKKKVYSFSTSNQEIMFDNFLGNRALLLFERTDMFITTAPTLLPLSHFLFLSVTSYVMEYFHSRGGKAMEQVAQRSCRWSIPADVQDQVG